ncbi:response regulator transcription factor [Luteolibacter pohnpeiensis]|uniref:Response regulator transcription factor n=1 Tax=Luteolibacter pohnpeiensis TaxID=454153 RepID=A0A934S7T8_9BACT|nr:response regulator transcription factor [Luteolibacter pohnpeiensis]MBK1884291.1 response regulator transcription factor [Luteolibacter pohnpeiensis]
MIRVAIVEDSKTTREGLETIVNLSDEFQCVACCDTAELALKLLPKLEPEVVLMDIQLPSMSGIECVSRLKEKLPDVQVIMVTVYEDPDRIFSALRAGALGYLLKRSVAEEVLSAIRDVRNGGAPMSGEIARKVISHFQEQSTTAKEVEMLTAREREVLELVAVGFSNKEIAERMSVTVEAVRWHLKHIYAKLHVHSRTEAALKFRPNS